MTSTDYAMRNKRHSRRAIIDTLIELPNVFALIPAPVPSKDDPLTPNTREDIDIDSCVVVQFSDLINFNFNWSHNDSKGVCILMTPKLMRLQQIE